MRQLTVDTSRVEHELTTNRTRRTAVQREINNLVGVLAHGGLSSLDTIKQALDGRTKEKVAIEARIEELTTELAPAQNVTEATRRFVASWDRVGELLDAAEPTEKRVLLQHLIEVVELRSAGGGWTYAMTPFAQPPDMDEGRRRR